jgi:hypothetical protein
MGVVAIKVLKGTITTIPMQSTRFSQLSITSEGYKDKKTQQLAWWLMPAIPATQEAIHKRIRVHSWLQAKV